jgi:2-keto-4-pentenoate hydratase/2-oxohepta-3-ene-1,7-dioic acid hydratase in catechol pathway
MPPNIYCFGRTYAKHAKELGNAVPDKPVIFTKTSSSLRGLEWNGAYPQRVLDNGLHFEAEIVLQIGDQVDAPGMKKVSGVGLGIDFTDRKKQAELKKAGLPWTLAKSFGGGAIVSDLVSLLTLPPWQDWEFEFYLDGQLKQNGRAKDMLFELPYLLDFLHANIPLMPGDYVFTGTPSGVDTCGRGQAFLLKGLGSIEAAGCI